MDTDQLQIVLDNELYAVKMGLAQKAGSHGVLFVDDDTGELDVDAFSRDRFDFGGFVDEVWDTVSSLLVEDDLSDVDWGEVAYDIASEY